MTTYRLLRTSWGWFGLVAREHGLLSTFLPQPQRDLRRRIKERFSSAAEFDALLPGFCHQVRQYFDGQATRFDVEIDIGDMPPFRQMVLELCRKVPYGKTATYADLARAAGKPAAARAVGGVMAHNPLPLVIPCHRILRSDGSLGGYSSRGGLNEKTRLLRLEGAMDAEELLATARRDARPHIDEAPRGERIYRRARFAGVA